MVGDVSLELFDQQRSTLCAAAFVSYGILYHDLVQHGAVVELHQERIADRTLARLVVLGRERLVFDAMNLGTQRIDARIRRGRVGVRLGRELAKDERVGDHVADGVTRVICHQTPNPVSEGRKRDILSVGKVVQGTMLVDDANGRFLRTDTHVLDVVGRFTHGLELCVNRVRSLDSGLSVEFGGIGNLEEDVLHDVGAKRHLELKLLALVGRRREHKVIGALKNVVP